MLCLQHISPNGDIKRLKRTGPSTLPCGTPHLSTFLDDIAIPIPVGDLHILSPVSQKTFNPQWHCICDTEPVFQPSLSRSS